MAAKKTMTLNLTDAEMGVLDELCEKKDLSKTAVLRQALRLYQLFHKEILKHGIRCASGQFQAHMEVRLCNDGPVTMLLESR